MNKDNQKPNGQDHEQDIFPSFPAPRVWNLGWEGEALSGKAHDEHTCDFLPPQPPINITIIYPNGRR